MSTRGLHPTLASVAEELQEWGCSAQDGAVSSVPACPREGSEHAAPHLPRQHSRPTLPATAVPLCHHLPCLRLHQLLLWQRVFPRQQLSCL